MKTSQGIAVSEVCLGVVSILCQQREHDGRNKLEMRYPKRKKEKKRRELESLKTAD